MNVPAISVCRRSFGVIEGQCEQGLWTVALTVVYPSSTGRVHRAEIADTRDALLTGNS